MERVAGRRGKVELLVVGPRCIILGVDGEGAYAADLGGLQRPKDRVSQQRPADSFLLPVLPDGKASQQHDGNRVARQTFAEALRHAVILDLTDGEAVVAQQGIAVQTEVGLSCVAGLILKRVAVKPTIEVRLTAIEMF